MKMGLFGNWYVAAATNVFHFKGNNWNKVVRLEGDYYDKLCDWRIMELQLSRYRTYHFFWISYISNLYIYQIIYFIISIYISIKKEIDYHIKFPQIRYYIISISRPQIIRGRPQWGK
jgi:hypothetical protein